LDAHVVLVIGEKPPQTKPPCHECVVAVIDVAVLPIAKMPEDELYGAPLLLPELLTCLGEPGAQRTCARLALDGGSVSKTLLALTISSKALIQPPSLGVPEV